MVKNVKAVQMGDNPGLLIAIDLTFLYLIMGPLVLAGVYVLFDYFIRAGKTLDDRSKSVRKKDPAFWTRKDIWRIF
jgi:hypothetical protein